MITQPNTGMPLNIGANNQMQFLGGPNFDMQGDESQLSIFKRIQMAGGMSSGQPSKNSQQPFLQNFMPIHTKQPLHGMTDQLKPYGLQAPQGKFMPNQIPSLTLNTFPTMGQFMGPSQKGM